MSAASKVNEARLDFCSRTEILLVNTTYSCLLEGTYKVYSVPGPNDPGSNNGPPSLKYQVQRSGAGSDEVMCGKYTGLTFL